MSGQRTLRFCAVVFGGIVGLVLAVGNNRRGPDAAGAARPSRPGTGEREADGEDGEAGVFRAIRCGARSRGSRRSLAGGRDVSQGGRSPRQGRDRRGHRPVQPGDSTRSEVCPGLLRPRAGPGHQGRVGQGRGRPEHGDSNWPPAAPARISTAVSPTFRRASTTRRWPTIPTPSGCIPAMPRRTAIGATSACSAATWSTPCPT